MRLEEYLRAVTDQIRCVRARDMVAEELREHILDQAEAYRADGMFEDEALEKAVRDMGDPVETGVSLDRVHRPRMSWGVLALAVVLALAGTAFQAVLAAGSGDADGMYWLNGHIRYTIFGILLMLLVYRLDYSILAGRAKKIAAVYLGLQILAVQYAYTEVGGAYRYINLGGVHLSLTSLLYLYLPLYGAVLYDYRGIGCRKLWKPLLWAAIPVWIALRISSASLAAILLVSAAFLFSVAVWHGWYAVNRKRTLVVFWAGMAAGLPFLILLCLALGGFADYQVARLLAFLGQSSETSYVVDTVGRFLGDSAMLGQSRMPGGASSVAGLWEQLPGCNSDYVFVSLITAGGILAGVLAAGLLTYLVYRIFCVALRQKNQLGMILGCACGTVFFLQALLHILINLNLMPVMAMNLPFFSAGGSQLMTSYILLGIVLSVYRYKDILPEKCAHRKMQKTI